MNEAASQPLRPEVPPHALVLFQDPVGIGHGLARLEDLVGPADLVRCHVHRQVQRVPDPPRHENQRASCRPNGSAYQPSGGNRGSEFIVRTASQSPHLWTALTYSRPFVVGLADQHFQAN